MVTNRGGNHSSYRDVSPVTHSLTCSLFYHLHVVMNVWLIKYLCLYCSKHYIIVMNPYCVTGFDIIQALSSRTYSCDLLKVPKCENFHRTDFFLFLHHKASMGRRL
jgi:hypothetical protein